MSATPKKYKAGEYLFREGDPPKSIFIIQKGTISILKNKGAIQVEVAKLSIKQILGEVSFFDRRPRSASARAVNDVEVIEIDFGSMDKIYDKIPSYMQSIIASVVDRLRKANDTIKRLQKTGGSVVEESPMPPPEPKKADEKKPEDKKPPGGAPAPAAAGGAAPPTQVPPAAGKK